MNEMPTHPVCDGFPARVHHFDRRFKRILLERHAANTIGSDGCFLLLIVVDEEDRHNYFGPVSFWMTQLVMLLGSISEDTLGRTRKKCVDAEWLYYEPGAKGKAARYRVQIPGEILPQICGRKNTDASLRTQECGRSTEGESGGESPENTRGILPCPTPAPDTLFARFWKAYPNKKAKARAAREFQRLKPAEDLLSRMLAAIATAKSSAQWLKDNGEYIPHPATWLKGGCREDEPAELSTIPAKDPNAPEFDPFAGAPLTKGVAA